MPRPTSSSRCTALSVRSRDRSGFDEEMVADRRMVVRLSVDRLYGLLIDRSR